MIRKPFHFLLALIMSMTANVALAYNAYIDGIYFNLSGTEATVTYKDWNDNSYSGTVVIPESITYNSRTYSVTGIGESAFRNCTSLTSITISGSVSSIGDYAFQGCTGLTSITISYGLTSIGSLAFRDCSGLTSVTIPESVTTIGGGAFEGTPWYDNQPDGMVYTGKVAYCYKGTMPENTTIDIKDGTLGIAGFAFNDCTGLTYVKIPESVTEIGVGAFLRCTGLHSITIPGNVSHIDNSTFSGCTGLTSITMPDGVTEIGVGAFYGCTGLTSITIPDGVTSIGQDAFRTCKGLTSITIPGNVSSISNGAFMDCSNLSSVNISGSVTDIGFEAFANTPWYNKQPVGLVYAGKVAYRYKGRMPDNTTIEIQDGTLGIAGGAFNGCGAALTSIVIPEGVITIGEWSFAGCSGLTSITIPEGVTSIGGGAFHDCTGLTSITIPESITKIWGYAFEGCNNLTSIKVGMKTPISIVEDTFARSSYEGATLYVPKGSKTAYQVAYVWKNFNNIVECNYVDVENQIIVAGNSTIVEIDVKNFEKNLVGFQMDLTLPQGVSIDKAGCELSSRVTDEEQELTIGKLEDGTYRLTSTSLSLTPISGNKGTLLTLKLTAEDGCVGGQATISNFRFSTSESEKIIMSDEVFDISILYKLIYMVDGTEYKTSTIAYGKAITPEAAPTKGGHTFSGWSEIPKTMPAKDVVVTGSFTINSYTLTYQVDGTEYKKLTVEYETPITPEAAPTKEGYTFSGWSWIPKTMPARDVVVTGTFIVNNYTLTYKVDGKEYKTSKIAYGSTITPEAAPTKEGYTFSGWSEIPRTMPAKDVVVTGSFTVNNYTLTYKVDGKVYKTLTVAYGTTVTPEAEPSKEGYTFSGWSWIPQKMPAEDVTVTGTFTVNNYTLTYMLEGKEYKTLTVAYGTVLTPEAAPTKEGYTFSGWSEIPETMPAKDVVVTGSYSINSYTLIYKVDGEVYKTTTVVYGTAITPEAEPTKEGYTFSGWSWIPQKMPAEDVVVTGTFTVNSYIVTFMEGDNVLCTEEVNYGETIPIPEIKDKYGLVYKWLDVPETMPAHDVVIQVDETDMIESLTPSLSKGEGSIYDLNGRKLASPQKGINIIRMSDGTSRKVMMK